MSKLDWLQYDNPWHKIVQSLRWGKLVLLDEPNHERYNTHRVEDVTELCDAEVVTSETGTGKHKLILDIDMPAVLVPSTTPGHHHLYIDKELTWQQVCDVLNVLVEVGIVQDGYRQASKDRGFTALRTPWTKK